jgi:hypothetical protein
VQRIDDRGELKELVLSLAAATTGASSTESVRVGVCKLAMLPGISFESLESDVRSDEVVSLSESTVNDLAKADSVGPSCGPARLKCAYAAPADPLYASAARKAGSARCRGADLGVMDGSADVVHGRALSAHVPWRYADRLV